MRCAFAPPVADRANIRMGLTVTQGATVMERGGA